MLAARARPERVSSSLKYAYTLIDLDSVRDTESAQLKSFYSIFLTPVSNTVPIIFPLTSSCVAFYAGAGGHGGGATMSGTTPPLQKINKNVQLHTHTHQVLGPAAAMKKAARREERVESGADVSLLFMHGKSGSSL